MLHLQKASIRDVLSCFGIAADEYFLDRSPVTMSRSLLYANAETKQGYNLAINITTHDVFSAQTWLDVSVMARNTSGATEQPTILFVGAIDKHPIYLPDGNRRPTNLVLTWDNNRGLWTNTTSIMYNDEGDKCILVQTQSTQQNVYSDCGTGPVLVHIAAVDSKYQFESNKATLALTWVLVGFSGLSVYTFVRDVRTSQIAKSSSGDSVPNAFEQNPSNTKEHKPGKSRNK